MAHLENRRGFLALEDCMFRFFFPLVLLFIALLKQHPLFTDLEKYPDAERAHFAPHRPVFLPPECPSSTPCLLEPLVHNTKPHRRLEGLACARPQNLPGRRLERTTQL